MKDNLKLDPSRCLRTRFNESSCCRCVSICPKNAVSLDNGLAINSTDCSTCLLCSTVCPSGALEQAADFSACLVQLSRVPHPVLGCTRTNHCSNATLACLGGLSEEHLLALGYSMTGPLQLNVSVCGGCPNSPSIAVLRDRLTQLSQGGFTCIDRIVIVDSIDALDFSNEAVDRRGFFKSLRTSLFQSAAIILSGNEQKGLRTDYIGKKLPSRRQLLNQIKKRLPFGSEKHALARFDFHLSFSDNCTACHGCVAICPTGALQNISSDCSPTFDSSCCTGCGLCIEFCLDDAIGFEGKTTETASDTI